MNRRTFLKTVSAGMVSTPLFFNIAKEEIKSKWIAFEDLMPEERDKFEIKNNETGKIEKAEVLGFEIDGADIDLFGEKRKLYAKKKMYIARRLTKNCMEVIDIKKWIWRYVS